MNPKFMLSTDSNEKRTMYPESDSSIVMIGNDTDEIIQEHLHSLLHKYKIGLDQSMKGSNFIFDYVSGIHYICNKVNLDRGVSYVDYPKWFKNKNVIINPKK